MVKKKPEGIILNTQVVPIEKLRPNSWNPNKQSDFIYAKEKNSIQTFGFVDPVTVRENGEDYEIIDGYHRWQAAKDLGLKEISINNLGKITEANAKKLTIILNELRGEYDPLKLAEVIKGLSEEVGTGELYKDLPFQDAEIDNLIKVTEFDWSQFKKAPGSDGGQGDDEGWVRFDFMVSKSQAEVVTKAIERLVNEIPLQGKNPKGQALELMAADSLASPIESFK
jgi:hypothetical protein